MKNLIIESMDDVFLKLDKNGPKTSHYYFQPKFNDTWDFSSIKKKKVADHKKFVYTNEDKLSKLPSYKIATNVLKTQIRQKHQAYDKKLVIDFNNVVRKTILDFLIDYLNQYNFKKCNKKIFDKIFRKLNHYLEKELFTVFCFTTIRNFNSDHKSITLPNDQVMRPRTPEEFSVICDFKDSKILPKIHPNFVNIKFILGTYIPRTSISEQKIKERFEKFLFALKILHEGDVQFGGIYYTESDNWSIKPIITLSQEPVLNKPKTKYKLESDSYTDNQFKKFVKFFYKINFTKGKYVFLGRSIKRFSQALENENKLDKIVDFVTCLESLYSSKEQQLSFRFAMRVAIILGQTTNQKLRLQEFILQIYDLRSKIVHGDDLPPIVLDGKKLDLDFCNKSLEKIARHSIKIFLDLLENSDSKNEIHKMIDNSIYDLNKQKSLSKTFKKLRLSEITLIQK